MKGTFAAVVALAALASTTPVLAAPKLADSGVATTQDAAPAPAQAKPTRYCFDIETTGSRLSKRVCQTREQWAAEGVTVPATR